MSTHRIAFLFAPVDRATLAVEMANEKNGVVLPPPPPNRQRKAQVLFAVVGATGLASAYLAESPAAAVALVGLVGGFQWLLVRTRRMEVGSHLALAALDRAARGRFDEARALLDAVPVNVHRTWVGQMVFSQRAALALYEGKLEEAVSHATVAAREGERLNATARIHQGSALSIRAVALAGLGDGPRALADVAAVRTAEYRQGAFVARAALAEALLYARDKDLDALAKTLREERPLLFGATSPRERLVARALARMVAAKKVSVYREAAKRDEVDLDEQSSWVARIAPEAAAYAKTAKLGAALAAPEEVSADALAAAEKAGPQAKKPWKRVLVLWTVLVVLFLAVWQAFSPTVREVDAETAARPVAEPLTYGHVGGLVVVLVGFFLLWYAFKLAQARRVSVELGKAMETRLRGNLDEATATFERLTKNKLALVAPQAHRELATIATMRGDFRGAQAQAEAGIAATRVSAVSLALSRPILLPMLHAELAVALAAEGRVARAEEELEKIRTGHPTYPFLAKDTFRVRLFAATSTNRIDEAAEMARSRPVDLPLTMDEELLCDLLRVNAGDVLPEGERERIEADVRDDARAASLLDRIAPTLRNTAFRKGPRIAYAAEEKPYSEPPTSEEEADHEGTEEKKKHLGLTV